MMPVEQHHVRPKLNLTLIKSEALRMCLVYGLVKARGREKEHQLEAMEEKQLWLYLGQRHAL